MRSLMVMALPSADRQGIEDRIARQRSFVGALGRFSTRVEMVVLAQQAAKAPLLGWPFQASLSRQQPQGVLDSSGHLRDLLAKPWDLILVQGLSAMRVLRRPCLTAPVFLDLGALDHQRSALGIRERLLLRPRFFGGLAMGRPSREERQLIDATRLTFVASPVDLALLAETGKERRSAICVTPSAAQLPEIVPPLPEAPLALFRGNFSDAADIEAAEHLITRIWPRVHAAVPSAELLIAGPEHERLPSFAESPDGIRFSAAERSPRAHYAAARLVCLPHAGSPSARSRVIEAAAWARPVVTTSAGASGTALKDGRDLLLRDNDAALAAACVTLLNDIASARQIGLAARHFVETHLSPDGIERLIAQQIEERMRKDALPFGARRGQQYPGDFVPASHKAV
jgi:glycosyltransferase involved in cell wall biosynthesis